MRNRFANRFICFVLVILTLTMFFSGCAIKKPISTEYIPENTVVISGEYIKIPSLPKTEFEKKSFGSGRNSEDELWYESYVGFGVENWPGTDIQIDKSPFEFEFDGIKDEIVEILTTAEVVVISSHGAANSIALDSGSYYCLSIDNIIDEDLSNLKLLVLLCCSTATGMNSHSVITPPENGYPSDFYPINYLDAFVYKGAHNVLAFNDSITVDAGNEAIIAFFDSLTTKNEYGLANIVYSAAEQIPDDYRFANGDIDYIGNKWVVGGTRTNVPVFYVEEDWSEVIQP